jgi:drug/metabolite transporter (DMT)-like permease
MAKSFVILIFCNLVWSANPMMGKMMMEGFTPFQAAWLRYASAFLVYVVAAKVFARGKEILCLPKDKAALRMLSVAAFMTFFLSPATQMLGLHFSRATDNAIIVAMEPLITVFLVWAFLKEKPDPSYYIVFAVSLLGFFLLSGFAVSTPNVGNLLLLVSQTGEASYSVFSKRLLQRFKAPQVFGSALGIGVVLLTIAGVFLGIFTDVQQIPTKSWLALLWIGPLGTTLTYLLWTVVLVDAPVMWMVLTLFIQPVAGSVLGIIFLQEQLGWPQALGAVLIIGSVMAYTLFRPINAAISHEIVKN